MQGLQFPVGGLPNQVTVLENRIAEIKATCLHVFQHADPKAFLGKPIKDDIYRGSTPTGEVFKFALVCRDCNTPGVARRDKRCFKCLGDMKADPKFLTPKQERDLFGEWNEGQCQVKLYFCSDCNFTVAMYERTSNVVVEEDYV